MILKNKSPKVSIVMNCHNGDKYLYKSLTSVISQSYKNWELIFWNNKSSDKSEKIFKSFRDQGSNILNQIIIKNFIKQEIAP